MKLKKEICILIHQNRNIKIKLCIQKTNNRKATKAMSQFKSSVSKLNPRFDKIVKT